MEWISCLSLINCINVYTNIELKAWELSWHKLELQVVRPRLLSLLLCKFSSPILQIILLSNSTCFSQMKYVGEVIQLSHLLLIKAMRNDWSLYEKKILALYQLVKCDVLLLIAQRKYVYCWWGGGRGPSEKDIYTRV